MLFIPRQRDSTEANWLNVTIERLDEVDETTGVQTEHPAEVVIGYDDGARRRWGIEDVRELLEMVLAAHDRDPIIAAAS